VVQKQKGKPVLEELKARVCAANLRLVTQGLVVETWGNVSGIDRAQGLVVIKPSGVSYDDLRADAMVVVALATGEVVEGDLRPSSDTPTHLELYRGFAGIGGVVHTHSLYATAWAQALREIPALGTTHADYFYGPVPVTRWMTKEEIAACYELNTGKMIVERFCDLDAQQMPAVLVAGHGPFCWGESCEDAVSNAVHLEYVAKLASETVRLNPGIAPMPQELLDKHYLRKHGPGKYYGQG
jgi:L-ribulose-5-phosphate 4-epimerase